MFEVTAGLIVLIAAQPVPAVLVLTVSPVTCRRPAAVKSTVRTGPCFPEEYTHRYDTGPGAVAVIVPW